MERLKFLKFHNYLMEGLKFLKFHNDLMEGLKFLKFHNYLMEGLGIDLKTFWGLVKPNQCSQIVRKQISCWFWDDNFGPKFPNLHEPELPKTQKRRTNILEWTQCFAMYTAILCKKYPDKLPDMLSCLILIIQTHMQYEGDAWLEYDRRFRQRAASDPQANWAKSDSTLWDITF